MSSASLPPALSLTEQPPCYLVFRLNALRPICIADRQDLCSRFVKAFSISESFLHGDQRTIDDVCAKITARGLAGEKCF